MAQPDDAPAPPPGEPGFAEMTAVFARIGLLSFGGPAGQIALMHRELVEERRWLDEARFLHALNYCMLLPGPEAMQLATYAGWLLQGTRGGIVAGLLFVLPGAILMTALSAVYLLFGGLPLVQGVLFGLKAAVLALVLEALLRIARRALVSPMARAVAVAAFAAIALFALPFPLIIAGAAVVGALVFPAPAKGTDDPALAAPARPWTQPSLRRFLVTLSVWLALWLLPLVLLVGWLGSTHVLAAEARFFSVMATVTFGGAYAVLAYVGQRAVDAYGWLRPDEMLAGLGLAETTPGPLILVLVFVGFLGAARQSGLDPLVGGIAGAAVALWFTFVPCFLWILVGAPYVERLRGNTRLAGALAAVTAAVVGIIADLGLRFGLHVLFATVGEARFGPLVLPLPVPATIDLVALAIATASAVALLRYRASMLLVLASAAAAGLAWRLAAG
jgi:chromate transporter